MAVDSSTVLYSWSLRSPKKCCALTVLDRSRYVEVHNRNPTNFRNSNFIDNSSIYKHNFYITSLNFLLCVWLSVRACMPSPPCESYSWRRNFLFPATYFSDIHPRASLFCDWAYYTDYTGRFVSRLTDKYRPDTPFNALPALYPTSLVDEV
jgi:hypothetical protein